jgi:hypothetical protein
MVLDRPNGQYNYWLSFNKVLDLRPSIVVVIILLMVGHAGSSLQGQISPSSVALSAFDPKCRERPADKSR